MSGDLNGPIEMVILGMMGTISMGILVVNPNHEMVILWFTTSVVGNGVVVFFFFSEANFVGSTGQVSIWSGFSKTI